MPFANRARLITTMLQRLAQQWIIAAGIPATGPKITPGVHHRAARDANRARPGTLVEAMGESCAAGDEPVKIWRVDFFIVQRIECAIALVIRNDDEEIGFGAREGRQSGVMPIPLGKAKP